MTRKHADKSYRGGGKFLLNPHAKIFAMFRKPALHVCRRMFNTYTQQRPRVLFKLIGALREGDILNRNRIEATRKKGTDFVLHKLNSVALYEGNNKGWNPEENILQRRFVEFSFAEDISQEIKGLFSHYHYVIFSLLNACITYHVT